MSPTYHRDRMRTLRAERIAAGMCAECGLNPPRANLHSCQECADIKDAKRPVRSDEIDKVIASVARSHRLPVAAVLADDTAITAARRALVGTLTERGLSAPEIARRLHISEQAVRQHRKALVRKEAA